MVMRRRGHLNARGMFRAPIPPDPRLSPEPESDLIGSPPGFVESRRMGSVSGVGLGKRRRG